MSRGSEEEKNRWRAEKLEAALETWVLLGSFAFGSGLMAFTYLLSNRRQSNFLQSRIGRRYTSVSILGVTKGIIMK